MSILDRMRGWLRKGKQPAQDAHHAPHASGEALPEPLAVVLEPARRAPPRPRPTPNPPRGMLRLPRRYHRGTTQQQRKRAWRAGRMRAGKYVKPYAPTRAQRDASRELAKTGF